MVGCALLASAVFASGALGSAGQVWGHANGSWDVVGVPLKSGQVEPITPSLANGNKVTFEWSVGANRTPFNWSCTGVTKNKSYPSRLEYGGKGTTALAFTGCVVTNVPYCAIKSAGAAPGEIKTSPMSIALTSPTTASLTAAESNVTELNLYGSGGICTMAGWWPVHGDKSGPASLSAQIMGEYKEYVKQPFTITGSNWVSYNPIKVSGAIQFELG
jgi:hypothetical protein